MLLVSAPAWSTPPVLEFSEGFLAGGVPVATGAYLQPNGPGRKRVEVRLNGQYLAVRDIDFHTIDPRGPAHACLPVDFIASLGLKPDLQDALQQDTPCLDLPSVIDGAVVAFDSSTLQLAISVPQAALLRRPRGLAPPDRRDQGITAAFVNYSASQFQTGGRASRHLGMTAGINAGAWRLRHRASLASGRHGRPYDAITTYLQRDLPAWNAQLWLGQGYTDGSLFESLGYTGLRIASDERMLPDSLRGYAPTVRGVALGTARVTIRQNGSIIHEITVPPGPFVVDDLYPSSSGGDLEITVTEADGSEQRSRLYFSAVPQALRAGAGRAAATVGHLRSLGRDVATLPFVEATVAQGLSDHLTLTGGLQLASPYRAMLAGVAVTTPWGAFGIDATHSRLVGVNGAHAQGQSLRLNHQRYWARSGTHVSVAAYRYTSTGFRTLAMAAAPRRGAGAEPIHPRHRYELSLAQRVGTRSSVSASAGHVQYWHRSGGHGDLNLSVHGVIGIANVALGVQRHRPLRGVQDTRFTLNMTVPLGRAASRHRVSALLSLADQGVQRQLHLNGTLGGSRRYTYSLAATQSPRGGSAPTAYLGYQGSQLEANAAFSRTAGISSHALGVAGSLVLHAGGLDAGPPVGEGFALIQAKGAEGARLGYGDLLRVGRSGRAVLPHITPYRWNRIDLDPAGLAQEVELLQSSQRVAPTAGSIVRVVFPVRAEPTLYIQAIDSQGHPLAFALPVQDADGVPSGAVGQGGVIALRSTRSSGALVVDAQGQRPCRLHYQRPDQPDVHGHHWVSAQCHPLSATPLP